MSFHGGSEVMAAVIGSVKPLVEDEGHRRAIYAATFKALRSLDWHDELDCAGMDDLFDRMLVEKGHKADYVAREAATNRSYCGPDAGDAEGGDDVWDDADD